MDKLEQATIYCKRHSGHKINFINLTTQIWEEPSCEQCLLEEGQLLKDYISIQTIDVCKDDHIFSNWSPISDSQLLQNIQLALKSENFYNEISGNQKLKELIQFQKQTLETQFQIQKSFISEFHNTNEQNTSFLKEQLNIFNIQKISSDAPTFLKQNILNQIHLFSQDIFGQLSLQIIIQNEENNNLVNLIFGKCAFCNFEQSNQMQILENQNEKKIRIVKQEQVNGQVYFKYQLNKQNIYLMIKQEISQLLVFLVKIMQIPFQEVLDMGKFLIIITILMGEEQQKEKNFIKLKKILLQK